MKDVAAFVVSIPEGVKVVKMEDVAKLPEIGRNQVGLCHGRTETH